MIQTTVKVSGMACSMCEAHINDTIRTAFPVEKVSSSHSKGETVILSQEPLDENAGTRRRPLGFLHEDR
jgi:copper chaperone CopZ